VDGTRTLPSLPGPTALGKVPSAAGRSPEHGPRGPRSQLELQGLKGSSIRPRLRPRRRALLTDRPAGSIAFRRCNARSIHNFRRSSVRFAPGVVRRPGRRGSPEIGFVLAAPAAVWVRFAPGDLGRRVDPPRPSFGSFRTGAGPPSVRFAPRLRHATTPRLDPILGSFRAGGAAGWVRFARGGVDRRVDPPCPTLGSFRAGAGSKWLRFAPGTIVGSFRAEAVEARDRDVKERAKNNTPPYYST
jgi:hypothetical protein